MGRREEARAHYEAAARYSTAYYGQLARARLGHKDIVMRPPPEPPADRRDAIARLEIVRAIEFLYAGQGIGRPFVAPPGMAPEPASSAPFARYKDALVPHRFSSNSLPPFSPLTIHLPAPPHSVVPQAAPSSAYSLRPSASPQKRYDVGSGENAYSVTGWLLLARRLGSIVSSTV